MIFGLNMTVLPRWRVSPLEVTVLPLTAQFALYTGQDLDNKHLFLPFLLALGPT